jgi:hypothetical protein
MPSERSGDTLGSGTGPAGYEVAEDDPTRPDWDAPATGTGAAGAAVAVLTAPVDEATDPPMSAGVGIAIAISVVVTVLFGVWPAPLVDFAHQARLLFN